MASEVVASLDRLLSKLNCTVVIRDIPDEFPKGARVAGFRRKDIIYATAARINKCIGPLVWEKWGEQMARLP